MSDFSKITEKSRQNVEMVKAQMAQKGYYSDRINGVSMRPLFRNLKDYVVVVPVERELKRHDVVLYMRDNYDRLPLHRILQVRENDYIIRGDNTYNLEYVPKDYVIGILKEFYRNGKHIECETSKKYKIYVFYISHTYWLRFSIRKVRTTLGRIKRKVFKGDPHAKKD